MRSTIQELNLVEVDGVGGGIGPIAAFFIGYFGGKAIDKTYDAVVDGKVDYSSSANQTYCATGA